MDNKQICGGLHKEGFRADRNKISGRNKAQRRHGCGDFVKKAAGPVLFFAVMALTFSAVLRSRDAAQILPALRSMEPVYLALAVLAGLFFVSAEGFMIWYLLRAAGEECSLWQCMRYSFVGFFYSGITPSATGGQPVQLYYMHKDGIRPGNSTVVLVSVAAAYKFALAVIGAALFVFWNKGLSAFFGKYFVLYGLGLFLNILLVLLLLLVLKEGGLERILLAVEKLLVRLRLWKGEAAGGRHEKLMEAAGQYRSTVGFLKAHKGKVFLVAAVTFLQRGSMFFLTWLIYKGLHLSGDSVLLIMALQAGITIAVDMLPLPGAQGITELVYHSVFAGVFTAGTLVPSMCIMRGISFYFLLLAGGAAAAFSAAVSRKKGRVKPCQTSQSIARPSCGRR